MENQVQTTAQQVQAPVAQKSEELQLIEARANAEFAVTPAGQMLRTFETTQRIGKMLSTSTIIPDSYQNNIANCAIAVDVAMHLGNGISPLTVMQNLVVVSGRPTWGATFLISCINTCGRFSSIQYKEENLGKIGKTMVNKYIWDDKKNKGSQKMVETDEYKDVDNLACTAYATDKLTGEVLMGTTITIKMAMAEGWYSKSNSKWQSMAQQMLRYRAASFWQRAFAPEIGMGFYTTEEAKDMPVVEDAVAEEIKEHKSLAQLAAERMKKAEEPKAEAEPKEDVSEEAENAYEEEMLLTPENEVKPFKTLE